MLINFEEHSKISNLKREAVTMVLKYVNINKNFLIAVYNFLTDLYTTFVIIQTNTLINFYIVTRNDPNIILVKQYFL